MKMTLELFIKQKTWFTFVSFLTEQSLGYARHYNPRFVYFLPTLLMKSKNVFQRTFFLKFCPYVWLVFKVIFWSRVGYDGGRTVSVSPIISIPWMVCVEINGGQNWSQYPQCLRMCSKFSSTFVEHQYLPLGSVSVIHSFLKTPSNLKGNLHWTFFSGLSLVVKHFALGRFPKDISWNELLRVFWETKKNAP